MMESTVSLISRNHKLILQLMLLMTSGVHLRRVVTLMLKIEVLNRTISLLMQNRTSISKLICQHPRAVTGKIAPLSAAIGGIRIP